MPYVKQTRKHILEGAELYGRFCETSGELNYSLTQVIRGYLVRHGLSYATCNDIVGALDNAKDEFRRRVQHPLENRKIAENGDVYAENETGCIPTA